MANGQVLTKSSVEPKVTITLLRGTPYSWYVESLYSQPDTTVKSSTWKFYTSGEGKISYAPFPAELIEPYFGAEITPSNGKINLNWKGTDVDNDIQDYDVFLSKDFEPVLLEGGVKEMFLNNIEVVSGTTYFWKVKTRDAEGNTTESQVSHFKVK